MSVRIYSVQPKSIAYKKGFKKDDVIHSINNNPINDVLDFDFYIAEKKLEVIVEKPDGSMKKVKIKKNEYEQLGIEFETYLIDKQHSCTNKCVFCFVDQLPKGMRESLYFKDDDDRLSFIFGNYITLTNMNDAEIDRIIKMHISPINISVHTTNPELRVKMMKNRFAGEVLKYVYKLANAGIKLNCQLVLCPYYNDGDELKKSLNDLSKLHPNVQSIACVPLGITKYREGLEKLTPYTKERAAETLDIIEEFSNKFYEEHNVHLVYAADEFYIKAGRDIPNVEYYEDLVQLENGVGMISLMNNDFNTELENLKPLKKARRITLATGVDAAPYLQNLVDEAKKKCHNLECSVIPIINHFFGETITVAGLVTGSDIIDQLKGKDLGDELLLPSCMLRKEQDLFLDNVSLKEVEDALNIKVRLCENDGVAFLYALLGEDYIIY